MARETIKINRKEQQWRTTLGKLHQIWPDAAEGNMAFVLGRQEDDGGFVLEPWFVSTRDWDTYCARRMLEDHGVCGSTVSLTYLGQPMPKALSERDVMITCRDCGTALVAEGRAREVRADVAVAASLYFWETQRYRVEQGMPEQAVSA